MGSEITDDTVEPLAYAVCNTDGVEGLSWAEVDLCEVSKYKYEDIKLQYLSFVEFLELNHLFFLSKNSQKLLIVFDKKSKKTT